MGQKRGIQLPPSVCPFLPTRPRPSVVLSCDAPPAPAAGRGPLVPHAVPRNYEVPNGRRLTEFTIDDGLAARLLICYCDLMGFIRVHFLA